MEKNYIVDLEIGKKENKTGSTGRATLADFLKVTYAHRLVLL